MVACNSLISALRSLLREYSGKGLVRIMLTWGRMKELSHKRDNRVLEEVKHKNRMKKLEINLILKIDDHWLVLI
jgi:hypothetical protein